MTSGPLAGTTILVAASEDRVPHLGEALRAEGAVVIPFPTVHLVPPGDLRRLDDALRSWSSFDWIVFTSTHGVDAVVDRARTLGVELRSRRGRIAAVGPATKASVEAYGLPVHAMPLRFLTDEIAAVLGDVRGKRILLPRSSLARKSLAHELRNRGAEVVEVDAYEAVPASPDRASVRGSNVDLIVVTSASAASNLAALLPEADLKRLKATATVAAIGPVTAEAARVLGFRVGVIAEEHTIPGLVKRLSEVRGRG